MENRNKKIKYNAIIACIKNPKEIVSPELRKKTISAVESIYKGLLISKCFIDFRSVFDDLKRMKKPENVIETEEYVKKYNELADEEKCYVDRETYLLANDV